MTRVTLRTKNLSFNTNNGVEKKDNGDYSETHNMVKSDRRVGVNEKYLRNRNSNCTRGVFIKLFIRNYVSLVNTKMY